MCTCTLLHTLAQVDAAAALLAAAPPARAQFQELMQAQAGEADARLAAAAARLAALEQVRRDMISIYIYI